MFGDWLISLRRLADWMSGVIYVLLPIHCTTFVYSHPTHPISLHAVSREFQSIKDLGNWQNTIKAGCLPVAKVFCRLDLSLGTVCGRLDWWGAHLLTAQDPFLLLHMSLTRFSPATTCHVISSTREKNSVFRIKPEVCQDDLIQPCSDLWWARIAMSVIFSFIGKTDRDTTSHGVDN